MLAGCSIIFGMSKTGFMGINLLPTAGLMYLFGVKQTLGLVLLIFIIADFFAIWKYRHTVDRKILFHIVPWGLAGITFSGWIGTLVPDRIMAIIMIGIIMYLLASIIYQDKKVLKTTTSSSPHASLYSQIFYGTISGVATTIANFAGGVVSLYLLKSGLKKEYIIGTAAFIFLVYNTTKLGVHYFLWHSIDLKSLYYSMGFWPWCIAGSFLGSAISKSLSNKTYKWVLIALAIFSILLLAAQ